MTNGRTVLSWGTAERCAPTEAGVPDAFEARCCTFSHVFSGVVSFLGQDDLQVVEVGFTPFVTAALHRSIAEGSLVGAALVRPPPLPRSGRDIGILYRRLLV